MIINIIITFVMHFIKIPFWLNENQLLYIFATIAQVTGGLFGLTLAAYTLIDDNLLKFLRKNKKSTIQDIQDYLNLSEKETHCRLQKLMDYGLVEKQESGKQAVYKVRVSSFTDNY